MLSVEPMGVVNFLCGEPSAGMVGAKSQQERWGRLQKVPGGEKKGLARMLGPRGE